MAASITSHANPAMLVWAREAAGLDPDLAAAKVSVAEERLLRWEGGEESPSIAKLRQLAQAYHRPLAVFFLPKPPQESQAAREFRRLPGPHGRNPPEVVGEINKALARREAALHLAEVVGEHIVEFHHAARLGENPKALAERLRKELRLPRPEVAGWVTDYDAYNGWRAAFERLGILVFQASGVSVDEMRGFSVCERRFPIVIVNAKDSPRARIFTLLHELVHLLLATRATVCDLTERGVDSRVEAYCNAVAGEILVPADSLRAYTAGQPYTEAWPEDQLSRIARRYWVSTEVAVRRLVIVGKASSEFYEQWREAAKRRPLPKERKPVIVPQERKLLASAGGRYVRLVLDAYHRRGITLSDVSGYLGVKIKHLPNVERAAYAKVGEEP